MRKNPLISIVIPAYNEEVLLPTCLESIRHQDFNHQLYEVIVVNNASTDKTAAIARKFGAKVVCEGKKGYVYALKRGVKVSKGKIVALTDADCHVPSDWITRIYKHFKDNPKLVGVGGVFSFFDGNIIFRKVSASLIKHFLPGVSGANMAFRKRIYEKVGGFDTDVNLNSDSFLFKKLRSSGKVKIDRRLVVITSARRFRRGLLKPLLMSLTSFFNYHFLLTFHRSLFFDFLDIREED